MTAALRWDIFCKVVDNLGDVGVCWRVARQLAAQHAADVRLWVDNLASLRRLAPSLDAQAARQMLGDIQVCAWADPFAPAAPADIVVETFGCALPEAYVEAMAARPRAPVWINLEYLSAEEWIEACHMLPSPHPQLPLVKYFFFPGFSAKTGGVPIERGLVRQRDAFQQDAAGRRAFLRGLGVPVESEAEMLVSVFCYAHAPVKELVEACVDAARPVRLLSFAHTPGAEALGASGIGGGMRRGRVTGHVVPFLSHDDYDRVLWACDWNFVRGEDSFVRGQLAARGLVWQAYPQAENVHALKLGAFLDRYVPDPQITPGLRTLWQSWNGFAPARTIAPAWNACQTDARTLGALAQNWAARLNARGDLVRNLAQFCAERV